jgi:protease-4
MGAVFLPGFEVDRVYFADALESLGVDVHVFRRGDYKSAVEPYQRNNMSPAARRNAQRWLDSLWAGWREQVASQRGLDPQQLQDYADKFVQRLEATQGDLAAVAVQAGLVTAAESLTAVRDAAKAVVGEDPEHGSFRQIWSEDYRRATVKRSSMQTTDPGQKILAVVHVQGEIVDGDGGTGLAGGDLVRDLIHDARRDPDVAGLLLRVDSPGGSVNASEQIRQALLDFQASGRPVVASMASTAASGGYWVSMNADHIVASPSTITGSIGVFGLVPTFAQAGDKLGLHADGVGTTQWAGALSPLRPLADNARATLDLVVGHDYQLFIQSVAQAREMTEAQVEDIASGQVWTGRQALEHGLVDALGDEEAALQRLRELAELPEDAPAEVFAPLPDPRFQWLKQFSSGWLASQVLESINMSWLQSLSPGLPQLTLQPGERGTLAHCLCEPQGRRSH